MEVVASIRYNGGSLKAWLTHVVIHVTSRDGVCLAKKALNILLSKTLETSIVLEMTKSMIPSSSALEQMQPSGGITPPTPFDLLKNKSAFWITALLLERCTGRDKGRDHHDGCQWKPKKGR
ncbi:MAG: hypothetical protein IPN95_16655 [Bacteroidetes bacterium]|nr:hypothetical protein [Bacteroidota bacterium]MBP6721075.1 hypothetical protein [Bacteroidia bacterium]